MRAILTVILVALGAIVAPAEAQPAVQVPRVGFLYPGSRQLTPIFDAFRQDLASLGYVEGQSIIIEPRFAEGQYERLPEIAAELARLKVSVIAMQGAVTVRAAEKVVTGTPIVFVIVVDPVAQDVVSNLERPGGNVTGVTTFDPQQPRKQLELLKEVIPGLKRVALLGDQGIREDAMKAKEEQAHALGLQSQSLIPTQEPPPRTRRPRGLDDSGQSSTLLQTSRRSACAV